MTAELLNGREIAKEYRQGLADDVELLQSKGIMPNLTVVIVGYDGASLSYVKSKHNAAKKIGMESSIIHLDEDISEDELLNEIKKLNKDYDVHGILVQVPLPEHIDEHKVLEAISPDKDVDGFSPINIGRLYTGQRTFMPCTPLGIMELLKHTGDIEGKDVAVVGRSHIVGQPVAKLLTDANATVTLMHSRTKDLTDKLKGFDVVISAVGRPNLIHGDDIKEGAVAIDVGNTVVDGKLVGDFDFDSVSEVAGYITPVPGGVGPMTITMVLNNTIISAKRTIGIN